jgi:predicted transposase YdaD
MGSSIPTLEQIFERAGLTAKWEARGRKEGKLEVAQKFLEMGIPFKKVAEATGFDTKTLKSLYPQKKVRPEVRG